MMIKTSYPLAAIAKQFNLDYQQVLFVADYLRGRGDQTMGRIAFNTCPLIPISHINEICEQYIEIQQGQLDWNEAHVLIF